MKTQKITLSLPESRIHHIKSLAAKRNLSPFQLVANAIEKMLAEEASYYEGQRVARLH